MAKTVNRETVADLFEARSKPGTRRWGLIWLILGCVLMLLAFTPLPSFLISDAIPYPLRSHVDAQVIAGAVAALPIVLGGVLLFRYRQNETANADFYRDFVRLRSQDLAMLMRHAYRLINQDIDDVLNFDADMAVTLDLTSDTDGLLEKLIKKSVVLIGPPGQDNAPEFKVVKFGTGYRVAFNPIVFSILFLTADKIFVYTATWNLKDGDFDREVDSSIFLTDIVQIGRETTSLRSRAEGLLKNFESETGSAADRLVRRYHSITLSMADGRLTTFPIEAPYWRDGSSGMTAEDLDEAARYTRVAQKIMARVQEAKRRRERRAT